MAAIEQDRYVLAEDEKRAQAGAIVPMLRLTLRREEKFFGPGVATLLQLIKARGSIQAACEEMGMSYSKAWKILRRASAELGFPLLLSQNGGAKGGESRLSMQAEDFLARYEAMNAELQEITAELFKQYFQDYEENKQ